ncbi:hypothetical protein MCOR02_011149 [Pyricularia oryzae]|nr:hypothetical protein MCOR02_011149 [Pyricularia oryzae]
MKLNSAFCVTVFTISVARAIPVSMPALTARGTPGSELGPEREPRPGNSNLQDLKASVVRALPAMGLQRAPAAVTDGKETTPTTPPAAGTAPSTPPTTSDPSTATKDKPVDGSSPPATPEPATPKPDGAGTGAAGTANPAPGAAGSEPARSPGTTPPAPPPTVEPPTKQNNGTATAGAAQPGPPATSTITTTTTTTNPAPVAPAAPAANGTLPSAASPAGQGSLDSGKAAPADPVTTAGLPTDGKQN